MWFKLSFYKVFPVLFHARYHHYLVGWQVRLSLSFWYFLTLLVVCPNVKSTYLPTISTYFNLSIRSIIIHFRSGFCVWNYRLESHAKFGSILFFFLLWHKRSFDWFPPCYLLLCLLFEKQGIYGEPNTNQ